MSMKIVVPLALVEKPEMDAMSHKFRLYGGSNVFEGDSIVFPFFPSGEILFSPDMYKLIKAYDCKVEGGTFFVVVDEKKLNENVPETFPDRVNEDESIRTWKDYSISVDALTDGSYRMRCLHFPIGSTVSQNGLTDEERRLWEAEFGGLLVKSEGMALKTKEDVESTNPDIKDDEIIK